MQQPHGPRICGPVERVTRMARGGQPQGEPGHGRCRSPRLRHPARQLRQHLLITPAPGTAIAPAQPEGGTRRHRQRRDPLLQPAVVVATHRLAAAPQQRRSGRHARKQIQHLEAAIAPGPGKSLQTPQGGIVPFAIGARGIEADEQQRGPIGIPAALQPPAVATAGAEAGGSGSGLTSS